MMKKQGFTLIELLIVVAIIAILAAIAVPNFLEAQARAKVARAKADIRTMLMSINAYMVDYNTCFPDNNDPGTPTWRVGLTFASENGGSQGDMIWLYPPGKNAAYMQQFYTRAPFQPLTTPISYLSSIPLDPFSKVVPMGLDTKWINPPQGNYMAYVALFSGGPDRSEGNWHYSLAGQGGMGLEYDPTNGTASAGDITRLIPLKDAELGRKLYPFASGI